MFISLAAILKYFSEEKKCGFRDCTRPTQNVAD